MAENKPEKKNKRGFKKKELPAGIVQHALSFDAIVSGGLDEYRRAIHIIEVFRQMIRLVDQRQTNYEIITAEYKYDPKFGLNVKINEKEMHRRSVLESPPIPGKPPQRVEANSGQLKSQRQFWGVLCRTVVDAGGPKFGSHMWDTLKGTLNSTRKAKLPAYKRIPRNKLVAQGKFETLTLDNYPMPIMRFPDSNNFYAHLLEDERGIVMRARYGNKTDKAGAIDFILDGQTEKPGGGAYTVHIDRSEYRWYVLKKLVEGAPGWSWTTPKINIVKRKNANGQKVTRFSINIQFKRPARPGPKDVSKKGVVPDVDAARVCEVVWDAVPGHTLKKRPWKDKGTDDGKIAVIHAVTAGTGPAWGKHIFVDGVVDVLRYHQKRKKQLEDTRDGRRRVARRLVRSIKKTLAGMAKTRTRQARDYNNCWSKDVVFFALRARCGIIELYSPPDGRTGGLLLDGSLPWDWGHFVKRVTDLANEKGIKVEVTEDMDVSEIMGRVLEQTEEVASCAD